MQAVGGDGAFPSGGPRSEVRGLKPDAPTVRHVHAARSFLSRIPVVVLGPEALREAGLDGRSGFLVSLIDGATSIEDLLDVSGMSAEETLALLDDLRLRGVVEL